MASPPPEPRSWVNALLFAGTIITTMAAGAMQAGVNPFSHPELLYKGIPFSATLLLILGVHECAHYLAARRWGVRATLPYFIPVPPPLFMIGTMGAFIKLRSSIPNRNALVDMGASGPQIRTLFFYICPAIYNSTLHRNLRSLHFFCSGGRFEHNKF